MTRSWRVRYAGAKYHVTARGNARQKVFHETSDYSRFMDQLYDAAEKDNIILYAYVLMQNHYHLFIETPRGNIDRFMQRLNTSYSMYHRYKRNSPGHCFQGRYGAKLVDGGDYALRLTRYIHLNPIKTKAFEQSGKKERKAGLEGYIWSSYPVYAGLRPETGLLDISCLELMGNMTMKYSKSRYRTYVEAFLQSDDEVIQESLRKSRYAIGDERFIEQIEDEVNDVRKDRGVYGDIKWPERKPLQIEKISEIVVRHYDVAMEELKTRSYRARTPRKLAVELACRFCNLSQRQVGEHFGYTGNGSVSKQRQRLREICGSDKETKKTFQAIIKELGRV